MNFSHTQKHSNFNDFLCSCGLNEPGQKLSFIWAATHLCPAVMFDQV